MSESEKAAMERARFAVFEKVGPATTGEAAAFDAGWRARGEWAALLEGETDDEGETDAN